MKTCFLVAIVLVAAFLGWLFCDWVYNYIHSVAVVGSVFSVLVAGGSGSG